MLWSARPARYAALRKHDPEKCEAVFGKDHARTRTWGAMTNQLKIIAL
jgi:hypothetical protein